MVVANRLENSLLFSRPRKAFALMIQLQVPLQQPCYDFSFFQALRFAELRSGLADQTPDNSPKHPSQ